MKKKPTPEPPPVIPAPPHLSARARALWESIVPKRLKAPQTLALLRAALEALDRADLAAEAIERDGLLLRKEGGVMSHVNPACKVEKDARAQFASIWKELGLQREPQKWEEGMGL
jgi:P27 family predicted phage terminase small subunit